MLNSDSRNDLSHWSINIDDDHIAWLQIQADGKSVNVLTHAVMNELATLIDELEAADHLAGLALLSGKPGGFVYGADIHEFETLKINSGQPISTTYSENYDEIAIKDKENNLLGIGRVVNGYIYPKRLINFNK